MSKQYDEIMAHIKVTDEMRSRILDNIQNANVTTPKKNLIPFSSVKKYLSIAACFAILLVGALALPRYMTPDSSENTILAPNGDIVNVSSIEELSETVGFEVNNLTNLPFAVEQTDYTAYWQEMAQVSYTGDGNKIIYRKSVGEEDNSGDYTDYKNYTDIEVNHISVQLKGNEESYHLAIWSVDGYSYSVCSENGLSAEAFVKIINAGF